ncbi:ABC transporter permease [Limoniibacter endophyticus]|uniref:ABC transporter permease n=1 Tax=Limoniibacter endophyticus TaxID=1565040 RepID=A0A8J3DKB3_9HYPH|nr:ABC transporter permease [Limoniibacter endophyticus]GHC75831.1 ABC transporter permease [Limoniibacter endophyticus]
MDALKFLSYGDAGWGDEILGGLLVTISLALATLPFGLAIGFLVALGKRSAEPTLQRAANIYTTIFRGLPELLTLFLVYYGAQLGLQNIAAVIAPDSTIEINAFVAGMVALAVVFSSYASEVFLAAFRAIPHGQYEAGHSLGLSRGQTMRLVISPQLLRHALPGLGNLWLILVKDTALVSIIGLSDLMRQTGIAARVTREQLLFFFIACLLYIAIALVSSIFIDALERRANKWERKT